MLLLIDCLWLQMPADEIRAELTPDARRMIDEKSMNTCTLTNNRPCIHPLRAATVPITWNCQLSAHGNVLLRDLLLCKSDHRLLHDCCWFLSFLWIQIDTRAHKVSDISTVEPQVSSCLASGQGLTCRSTRSSTARCFCFCVICSGST